VIAGERDIRDADREQGCRRVGRVAARVESPHELRGRRPHRREHAFQLAAEEIDAPVGEAGGE